METNPSHLCETDYLILSNATERIGRAFGLQETKTESKSQTIDEFKQRILYADKGQSMLRSFFAIFDLYEHLTLALGGDTELIRHWVKTHNSHLGYAPIDHIYDVDKLTHMASYLKRVLGQ